LKENKGIGSASSLSYISCIKRKIKVMEKFKKVQNIINEIEELVEDGIEERKDLGL
jgi:hypothetical protein